MIKIENNRYWKQREKQLYWNRKKRNKIIVIIITAIEV